MIDVYDVGGIPTVYHGSAVLGSIPLISVLDEIKTFLDSNANDILTIIFESYKLLMLLNNRLQMLI